MKTPLRIALHGSAGSGKSTLAKMLTEILGEGFAEVALADPIKRIVHDLYRVPPVYLWGESRFRETPREELGGATPRHALQTLGTEWGRSYDDSVWLNKAWETVQALETPLGLGQGRVYDRYKGVIQVPVFGPNPFTYRGVVVSDVRFSNEAKYLATRGFFLVKLKRDVPSTSGSASQHSSEAGVADTEFDVVFDNNGGLDELRAFARTLCTV